MEIDIRTNVCQIVTHRRGCRVRDDWVRAQFTRFDDRFRGCDGDEWLRPLFTDGRWAEGPTYSPAGRYLLFSDIPNDRIMRWDELTGAVGVFREPAHFANGLLIDRAGRLLTCEQGSRRLTRTEPDGSITVVADRWEGRRFNSPDVVVEHPDGSLWFSDPSYGIDSDYEGVHQPRELDHCSVYRLRPGANEVSRVIDDRVLPNGLAFSPDHTLLYVVDCADQCIYHYAIRGGDIAGPPTMFAAGDTGALDSIAVDSGGRVWAAAGEGVDCYHADGTRLARLPLPEPVANLTFGGPRGNDLFIAATSTVFQIRLKVTGMR